MADTDHNPSPEVPEVLKHTTVQLDFESEPALIRSLDWQRDLTEIWDAYVERLDGGSGFANLEAERQFIEGEFRRRAVPLLTEISEVYELADSMDPADIEKEWDSWVSTFEHQIEDFLEVNDLADLESLDGKGVDLDQAAFLDAMNRLERYRKRGAVLTEILWLFSSTGSVSRFNDLTPVQANRLREAAEPSEDKGEKYMNGVVSALQMLDGDEGYPERDAYLSEITKFSQLVGDAVGLGDMAFYGYIKTARPDLGLKAKPSLEEVIRVARARMAEEGETPTNPDL